MTKFTRGMTVHQRRKLREEILGRYLERAHRQAAEARLTLRCRNAMYYTFHGDPATAREYHALCKGEEPGNSGCLCQCHDVVTGEVAAGQMAEMP